MSALMMPYNLLIQRTFCGLIGRAWRPVLLAYNLLIQLMLCKRCRRAWRPILLGCLLTTLCTGVACAQESQAPPVASLTDDGSATTIVLSPTRPPKLAFLYSATARAVVQVGAASVEQAVEVSIRVVQGEASTVTLGLNGPGEVLAVTGEGIESWSVRTKDAERFLDLQIKPDVIPMTDAVTPGESIVTAKVEIQTKHTGAPTVIEIPHFSPGKAIGFDSQVQINYANELVGKLVEIEGFLPLAADRRSNALQTATGGRIAVRIAKQSTAPEPVELIDAALTGTLDASGKSVSWRLTATARVTEAGARLRLLSGKAALSDLPTTDDYRVELTSGDNGNWLAAYDLVFAKTGEFPLDMNLVAGVSTLESNWKGIDLTIAASAVVPVSLQGFPATLEFRKEQPAMVPIADGDAWRGFLPATGRVYLQWKDALSSGEGKLFFTTTARVEAQVGPGLLRQDHQLQYQVLQGQLKSLSIQLSGPGEIIDVEGENLIGWKVIGEAERQTLEVTLSQPISGQANLRVLSQTALADFPVRTEGLRLKPIGTTRHSGYLRISNAGSVRVEPSNLQGLTQLAPEQFPGEALQARQAFVYRFPSAEHAFTITADRVQPEVNINALVVYLLTEADRSIVADIELDIREAAIREWDLSVPGDYSVVSVTGASLADYVVASEIDATDANNPHRNLKLIFSQDVEGRQLVSLRLEKSEAAAAGVWNLPRIEFPQAKEVRGDIGVASAPGYRVVAGTIELLVEKPLSYFPKPQANLQQAFRIREPGWSAAMQVEPLERSIQSDAFHLVSLSQGTIYGSTLVNYFITGAPTGEFRLTVPATLGNVTVDGQDIRTWRREGDQLLISLHQPVLGPYTLLVTFQEKPNEADDSFTAGLVAPIDVQGDRGYIEVVSPIQVEVQPLFVSSQLLVLDPLELPAEFRLLSTAPTLGTWQYTERPFDLKLKVNWFEPGSTAGQVVEYSEANSRVSPDGELVTDLVYYVKSRGERTLRLQLPAEPVKLWSVTVNGQPVTARQTETATLIPLPGGADPNVPIEVGLRLGKPSVDARDVELLLPAVDAPILKTQWNVRGDENHVLVHHGGTVEPAVPVIWPSGFDWVANRGLLPLVMIAALVIVGALCSARSGLQFFALVFFVTTLLVAGGATWDAYRSLRLPEAMQLSLPVLSAGETIALQVQNVPLWRVHLSWVGLGLVLGGVVVLGLAWVIRSAVVHKLAKAVALALLTVGILMFPNGGLAFFALLTLVALFQLSIPTIVALQRDLSKRWWSKSAAAKPETSPPSGEAGGAVVTGLLILFALMLGMGALPAKQARADEQLASQLETNQPEIASADSLVEQWQLASQGARLTATATTRVTGKPGDRFVLLQAPATLTRFDGGELRLNKIELGDRGWTYVVTIPFADQPSETPPTPEVNEASAEANEASAEAVGERRSYEATFEYQLEAIQPSNGIPVLTGRAALHELELAYDQPGWEVSCDAAVRIEPVGDGSATKAKLLLGADPASVILRPQSRDLANEATQFFVEGENLYTLGPGVVDGRHRLNIRTSQGRVRELMIDTPDGFTVSSVEGPVSSWQFDADNLRLKLQIDAAANSDFSVLVETQRGLDSLPTELSLKPLKVEAASGEVGLIGVAFSSDAQPEKVDSSSLSLVSLSDLDASLAKTPQGVLHRVYRHGQDGGAIDVRVAPVTPEVRVASRQAISFGDERILLSVNFAVEISRTGLFQVSFPLPAGLEVESLSGDALHHWVESVEGEQRQIILHLNGKTLGAHSFALSLAGPAPTGTEDWQVPRFELNEAERQTGDLVIRPMTGLRLRAVSRQNVSEADPRSLGGQGEGALAFRLLQTDWTLTLGVEKLDAWITGDVLHEVTLREGQTRSALMADFNIQNASVRSLMIALPITDAEEIKTVRASGKSVADFVRTAPDSNLWELQFKQRVIGRVQFQIEFERRGERANAGESLSVVSFPDARQMSYYVAVRTGGRLEIEPVSLTQGWQRLDWSVVPAGLRDAGNRAAPTLTLRAMEPGTPLSIQVVRHSLAESLKLRVVSGQLTTLLSPIGNQLTSVDVNIDVIQRSNLSVTLPEGGQLFNIFVNGESVHSIREGGSSNTWQFYILPGVDDRTAQVRFVYLLDGDGLRKLKLISPQLNVPLENVNWDVIAPKGYELVDDDGDLELKGEQQRETYDRKLYLSKVNDRRQTQERQAKQMLAQASQYLEAGEQTKAERALSNVANRGALDAASNEDARIQLENLQTQQAVIGLNTRRQRLYLDNDASQTEFVDNEQLRQAAAKNPVLQQEEVNFRPQEMSQLLAGNTSEDNAILQQIAGRLVQHQRTTEAAPQALVVNIPEEGTVYSFTRSVQVTENAPLELDLQFRSEYKLRIWEWFLIGGLLACIVLTVGRVSRPIHPRK